LCLRKAHYAAQAVAASGRFVAAFERPFFKELVVRDSQADVAGLIADARDAGFLAGVPLGQWYPELDDCLLITVTEKRTKSEIENLARCLAGASQRSAVHA
jgi:glycine dehydrogenase subunit 1